MAQIKDYIDLKKLTEHKILEYLNKRIPHSIPRYVIIWSWWKRIILEQLESRNIFQNDKELSNEEFFKRLLKFRPIKTFPSFARRIGSSEQRNFMELLFILYQETLSPNLSFEIKNGSIGLTLWSKRRINLEKNNDLYGPLYHVKYNIGSILFDAKYPSLYQNQSDNEFYILCGALALINHSCSSTNYFKCKIDKQESTNEILFYRLNVIGEKLTISKNQEIFVYYSKNCFGLDCKCLLCNKK